MSLQSMVKKIADDAKKVVQSATTKTTTNSVTSQSNNETPNTAGDWIGSSDKLAQTQNLAGTGASSARQSDYESELNRLKRLKQEATASQLKAQKERTLQSLAEQEVSIQPRYYEQKRQAGATSALGAKSFAEHLANRGLTNSGAAAQGEINRQAALQGTLGQLGTAEAQEYAQIARTRQNAEQNYASDLASANAQLEANHYNNLIEENQRQRLTREQLLQNSVQQYADDFQARLNQLKAEGKEGTLEYAMTDAARGQKIANAQSGVNYNWAMQQILNGNINYTTALNAGMTVEQAQQKYNEYQAQQQMAAQAEADQLAYERNQQAIVNAQKWAQTNNDINNTNSLIQQRQNSENNNTGNDGKQRIYDI